MVGPSLADVSKHSFIAGQLANNPDNLVLWIEHPQQVRPGGDMPEMGVTEQDARDIAAYLYSLH
jgi:cytochrome c1